MIKFLDNVINNPFIKQSIVVVKNLFAKSMAETAVVSGSVGVDIGSHSVKIVKLEVSKDGFKILDFAIENVVNRNYADALVKAIAKAKITSQQSAFISLSGQGVVSRYVELPLMNRAEFVSSMRFEVEKYVPFPIAEVASDYAIICEMKDKAKMSVLIAAAKNDLIQKRSKLASEANLNLKGVDLDCLALANFFTEFNSVYKKGACVCVINMGKSLSSINILVDGVPSLSRDIFIGGDDITKKMSESLELDYVEAENLKISSKDKKEELLSIWDLVLTNLAAEIRVSLDYFEARNNRAVDKIFILGGTSRLEGIEEYLNHLLAVEVKKIDYTSSLKFAESVNKEEFKKNSDLMAIALGLALR